MGELGGGSVFGDEDHRPDAGERGVPGEACGRVAGGGGGDGRRAALQCVDDADGAGAVFERGGRVAAIVLHQELGDAKLAGEAGKVEDGCAADGPGLRNGGRIEGQQLAVAPQVERPAGEGFGAPGGADAVEIEADFEDAFVGAALGAGQLTPGVGERHCRRKRRLLR